MVALKLSVEVGSINMHCLTHMTFKDSFANRQAVHLAPRQDLMWTNRTTCRRLPPATVDSAGPALIIAGDEAGGIAVRRLPTGKENGEGKAHRQSMFSSPDLERMQLHDSCINT